MVIKKVTIKKNPSLPKEDSYDKFIRIREEKEAAEKKAAQQKIIDDAEEKERAHSIIFPYLDSLDAQLDAKELEGFWVFPDRSGFKKLKIAHRTEMQKIIYKDVEKYKNRKVVDFIIKTYHREGSKMKHSFLNIGTYLGVHMTVYAIDEDGKMGTGINAWGCKYKWEVEDFKITKLSFKLLEKIMEPVVRKQKQCTSIVGTPLRNLLKDLKKLKDSNGKYYNFDDVLNPLAGL